MSTDQEEQLSISTTTNAAMPSPMQSPSVNTPMSSEMPIRSRSPSPSVTPSLAIDAIPVLDRSVSTPSSSAASTMSNQSRKSRLSDGGATVVKRRGYMRPQGTAFADSARNRDSVMSLGSIAHMQYYFARTGLLDGKGAQAREPRKKNSTMQLRDKENVEPPRSLSHGAIGSSRSLSHGAASRDDFSLGSLSLVDSVSAYAISDPGQEHSMVESPTELYANPELWADPSDPIMLPPTVSTYKLKPEYTEPVPDLPVLRRELKEALQDACKVLEESQKEELPSSSDPSSSASSAGFHEIQGLHTLDITTLAIRAAKNYYTAHPSPAKLYAIKPERQIRSELHQVLDVLKRMALRNFRGGIRLQELTDIITWIEGIDRMLKREEAVEAAEAAERKSWVWLRDEDWTSPGREGERERERAFLASFDPRNGEAALPEWNGAGDGKGRASPFLLALRDGQRLCELHNALVARSRRRFATIAKFHGDVGKPYRVAENLKFWVKAAELRWDVFVEVPALELARAREEVDEGDEEGGVWGKFDRAVLEWCRGVRKELTEEWDSEALREERKRPPEVKVEGIEEDGAGLLSGEGMVGDANAAAVNEGVGVAM